MADVELTAGNDSYTEPYSERNEWRNFFGRAGNDTIRAYQGGLYPGPGNDLVERLIDPENPNRQIHLALFDYGDNLRINLVEGWAEGSLGGRDTLINIRMVHGNGAASNWMLGDANDNHYWPNGGHDTFEGGAGHDTVSLNSGNAQVSANRFRALVLDEMNIVVSADGREATVTPRLSGQNWSIRTLDVEGFDVNTSLTGDDRWVQMRFADFITQQTMARDTIAAGGTLRWNAASPLGTAVQLSYSFVTQAPASGPGAPGFRAFTADERAWVREILAAAATVANITFTEVVESGSTVGQLRFGVSQQATSKGLSWLPGTPGAADLAGDVWMDRESMADLAPGTEGYQALLHEIGHALGLRHPRNVDAGDAWPIQLLEAHDRTALTVMSQNPSPDGLFRADWGPLDVLALRLLYGTRSVNTGDTLYALDGRMGLAQFSFVDDGGNDVLDASALDAPVTLNLAEGGLSSIGTDHLGGGGIDNIALPSGAVIERAIGSRFDDVLIGGSGNNTLDGGAGSDWIDGGGGIDTVRVSGPRSAYLVDNANGMTQLRAIDGTSGTETLLNIERVQFADLTLTLATTPLSSDQVVLATEDQTANGTLPTPTDSSSRTGLTWTRLDNAAHGTATIAADGSWSYTPSANYWGSDSFGWRVSSAQGSNDYRVVLQVQPVNDAAPVGANLELIIGAGVATSARVPVATDADGDALTYTLLTLPASGALSFESDGRFSFTPAGAVFGDVSFTYAVSDGLGGRASYAVNLRQGLTTMEDTALTTSLPDPVGAPRAGAVYTLATAAVHGVATVSAQGQLLYTPAANFNGTDSIAYDVTVNGTSSRTVVQVSVAAVNDVPTVADGTSQTNEDVAFTAQLPLATDSDGDTLSYALAAAATLGTVVVESDGRYRYTPNAQANGTDRFEFTVIDGQGGSSRKTMTVQVQPVNDPVTGTVAVTGAARVGQTLSAVATLADVEGLGAFSYAWLRGGSPIAGATAASYISTLADVGQVLAVRVSFTDGAGNAESVTSTATSAVTNFTTVTGSSGNDRLTGTATPDAMFGLAGEDTLDGGADNDSLQGGEGTDVLVGGAGNDTIEGGDGLDVAVFTGSTPVIARLQDGSALQGGDADLLAGIEVLFGGSGADQLTGRAGDAAVRGETLRGGGGNDTLDGGSGNDTAEWTGSRSGYAVSRDPGTMTLTVRDTQAGNGDDGTDTLRDVERLVFGDQLLAFGPRAEEVARVAIVLWSVGIVGSSTLFARGLSFYDVGYDFNYMCRVALMFHPEQGLDFAFKLVGNSQTTTRFVSDVLGIMTAAGGGEDGRAAAVAALAMDPAVTALLESTGIRSQGVVADLVVPDFGVMFALTPGP
jgi:Ca2+-binding RTX toxin-like protein